MRTFSLDDGAVVFAFRGATFLALLLLLVHSPRQETALETRPFALAVLYLLTSLVLWRAPAPALRRPAAQAAAYLWDVAVISSVIYFGEGFDDELYLTYFLIMFMSGLAAQARQSFLIGTVSSLVYAALWAKGRTAEDVPLASLLLRFAFFYATAFFTAATAERVRERDRRSRALELRLALGRIANGGWGLSVVEDLDPALDPELSKTVRAVNALVDNLSRALKRAVAQNDELREAATTALLRLSHEKVSLGAAAEKAKRPS